MSTKKLFLILGFCVTIVVLIYICKMLSPLFDDVWKILIAGVPVGFAVGFWSGIKWKTFDIEEKKKLHADEVKFDAGKKRFEETGKF